MNVNDYLNDLITNYIQSFTYSFETAYQGSHEVIDDLVIFHYGQEFINSPSEVIPYQSVVFSRDKSPEEIHEVITNYKFKSNGSYAVHEDLNPQNLKIRYR